MKQICNLRLLPCMLAATLASIVAVWLVPSPGKIVWAIVTAIVLLCAIFVPSWRKYRMTVLCCVAASVIATAGAWIEQSRLEQLPATQGYVYVSGIVDAVTPTESDGSVTVSDGQATVYLRDVYADGAEVQGKVRVILPARQGEWKCSDRIVFRAMLTPILPDAQDGYSMRNYRNGVRYYAFADAATDIQVQSTGAAPIAERIRGAVREALYRNCTPRVAGFLYAMTFGDTAGVSDEVRDAFSETGVAHLFAVSGLHVGIIAAAITALLRKQRPYVRLIVTLPILIAYCWLCRFTPSTVRATVMFGVGILAHSLGRRNDRMSTVSLAAIAILWVKPLYLFDLGFLMSFLAVFGIVLLNDPLQRLFARVMPSRIASALAVSISANCGIFPIMMLYFGKVSLIFILANLIVVPIVSALFVLYLPIVFLCAAIPQIGILLTVIGFPFQAVIGLVEQAAAIPFAVLDLQVTAWLCVPFLLTLVFLSDYCMLSHKPKGICAAVLACVLACNAIASVRGIRLKDRAVYGFRDSEYTGYALVASADVGNYLLVNGPISEEGAQEVTRLLREKTLFCLDGVIVRERADADRALRYLSQWQTQNVYCADTDGMVGEVYYRSHMYEQGITVWFDATRACYVNIGGLILAMADDTGDLQAECDVALVDRVEYALPDTLQVNDAGKWQGIVNCMSSQFTFYYKNGKIEKIPHGSVA